MPRSTAPIITDPQPCDRCGRPHVTRHQHPSCAGHVNYDRDSYVPGQPRQRLDTPLPCLRDPMQGQTLCHVHGGAAPNHRRAAAARKTAAAIEADALKLLAYRNDELVDDPLALIHEMTSMAYALTHAAAARVNDLDDIRYTGGLERDERGELRGTGTEQLRAEVALFERNIDRTARLAELLVKHAKPSDVDDTKSMLGALGDELGIDDA